MGGSLPTVRFNFELLAEEFENEALSVSPLIGRHNN